MCRAPPVTMATLPPSLIDKPPRSTGVMEYWNIGIWTHHSTTPIFHHSHSSLEPFQLFFEVERLPPRLDTEGLGDNPRRVVSRSAGVVTTGLVSRAAEVKTVDWRPIVTPTRKWPVLERLIT